MRHTIVYGSLGIASGISSVGLTFSNVEASVRFAGELVTLFVATWSAIKLVTPTVRKLSRWVGAAFGGKQPT